MMKPALLALLFSTLSYSHGMTLEEAYKQCKDVTREELEPCVMNVVNELGPLIREGIDELGLEHDNCTFDKLDLNYDEGSNHLAAHYEHGKIKGMDDFNITYLKVDYENKVAVWSVFVPEFINMGRYDIDANVLSFPIYGNGTFWNRYQNLHFYGVSKLDIVDINGVLRLQEIDTDLTFSYEKASMRMNNLYNGDSILQAAGNSFLNSNVDALLDEMRPSAKHLFHQLTGNHVNIALSKISLEDMAGGKFIKQAFSISK